MSAPPVLTAVLDGIVSGVARRLVNQLPSVQNLPNGVQQTPAGDAEFMQEMATGFAMAFARAAATPVAANA